MSRLTKIVSVLILVVALLLPAISYAQNSAAALQRGMQAGQMGAMGQGMGDHGMMDDGEQEGSGDTTDV